MKKVVITGGTGLIGIHLAPILLDRGFEVHVTSRKSAETLNQFDPRIVIHTCDIGDYDQMRKICENAEYIFHFVSRPDQDCIDHPIETEETNVGGTVVILEIAKAVGIKKLVFASSAMVYGNETEVPLREDMLFKPAEPYGLYKFFGEKLVQFWAEQYNVPAISLRFFNVYGPGDIIGPNGYVMGRFLDKRRNNEPLTIDGDGTDTRDYIHVEDIARACIAAVESSAVKGEVFNIGSGVETSLNDLASIIGGEVTHLESRPGSRRGPRRRVADISLAKKVLGWTPTISLQEGITQLKSYLGMPL